MNKRILTLVLALVMILGLAVTSFAAPEVEKITNPKVQWLIDKNIVVGRLQDDGKTKVFDLDKTITREEVAKLVILYRGSENLARSLQGTKGIFKDVAIDRWSNGYINVAALADLIVGYPDGNFGPDKDITYAEIAAILVRMNSKWTAADEKAAIWPISFIKAAEEFGILKGIKLEDANAPAVREKVFEMMYNAFDGKYQAPIVNDRLGVISKIWGNSIQLNGKDEYKVTDKTIFVGNTLKKLFIANDFYGSLVRIAVNDDNEITHLVALGANGLAYEADKWEDIAEKVHVEKVGAAVAADITDKSDNDKVIFADGLELKVTEKTRFFVADSDNNNFFEAKKLSDAIDTTKPAHLQKVYAGYDVQPVTGVKYAKVVVFSTGKEAKVNKNLVRITASVGAGYDFKAEDTKAVETEYSTARADKFPFIKLHKMDVVNLHMSGDKDVVNFDPVISYDSAPVFKVIELSDSRYQKDGTIKFNGNQIRLEDKYGQKKYFALDVDGVNVFTNALGVGAHVQISFKEKTNDQVIDVISKVDLSLRGEFPGYVPGKQCGVFHSYDEDGNGQIYVKVKFFDDKAPQNYKVDSGHASLFVDEFDNVYGIDLKDPDYQGKDLSAKKIEVCGVITDVVDKTLTNLTITEDLDACKKAADDYIAKVAAYDFTNNIDNGGSTAKFKAPGTATDEGLAAQIKEAKELADAYDKLGACAQAKVDADTTTKDKVDDIKEALAEEEANPRPNKAAVEAEIAKIKEKLEEAKDNGLTFAAVTDVESFIKAHLDKNVIDDAALNVAQGAAVTIDGKAGHKYTMDFTGKDPAATSETNYAFEMID